MYVGRFAPSPTGPLHLGSLCTALASYLDARQATGQWLLRIEDIDPPREPAGAALSIIASLTAHGLIPPAPVLWQSTRAAAYDHAVQQLLDTGEAFHCTCSRQELAGGAHASSCPRSIEPPEEPAAVRVRMPSEPLAFDDALLGRVSLPAPAESFVVRRRDGLHAYQLAVVVDDAFQQVTHIVRGRDLLDSTPFQLHLQALLGLPRPRYAHLPLLVNAEGQKLSKQNLAPAIDDARAAENIRQCLMALGQTAPAPQMQDTDEILGHAAACWDSARISTRDIPV